jgi:hypothetical protein
MLTRPRALPVGFLDMTMLFDPAGSIKINQNFTMRLWAKITLNGNT